MTYLEWRWGGRSRPPRVWPMRVVAERILIVLLGAIGDVVRALPLAQRLRAGYSNARIAWALEPLAAPLVAHHRPSTRA